MMTLKRGKKALSPVVATVLLIALVLVLAAIIFLWARGFISEQIEKFGQPIDNVCDQISFKADLSQELGNYLEIVNSGNVPIYNFNIKQIKGGSSTIEVFKFSVDPGKAVREQITINPGTEKIIVYPSILGNVKGKTSNKAFACYDIGQTIPLK